jgi:Tol biopolymer transport system component
MKKNILLFWLIFGQAAISSSPLGRLGGAVLFAQLPETDIFIADIKNDNGKLSFSTPLNITKRKGYDNQPYFMPDGKSVLFVALKDTTQSDIYKYDLASKKLTQLTHSPESEYSPNLTPDGKSLSVVRVDKDQGQRFYTIPLNDVAHPKVVKGSDAVGYYCWLNDSLIAMFILGDAMTLQILDAKTAERKLVASDIGRCMKLTPDKKNLYFVLKQNENEWAIFNLDIATQSMTKVVSTLKGSEDYAIMPDGSLLMGSEGKLYQYKAGDKEWMQVGDFSASVGNFYRITLNAKGDRIALVGFTGAKP